MGVCGVELMIERGDDWENHLLHLQLDSVTKISQCKLAQIIYTSGNIYILRVSDPPFVR